MMTGVMRRKKMITVDLGREEDVRGEEEGGGWQE